jgi:cytochrome P450
VSFPINTCESNKSTFGDFSFIPEGTNAFVHTYSLQRDPRYFSPLPDSFLPERWLSQEQRLALEPKIFDSQEKYIHNTDAFIAFSVGPTNCAGKSFAWLEMRMAVSVFVSRFDLKLDPSYNPQKWYEDIGDYFAMIKGPMPTLLSDRQSVRTL